jgi:hypothetical protein
MRLGAAARFERTTERSAGSRIAIDLLVSRPPLRTTRGFRGAAAARSQERATANARPSPISYLALSYARLGRRRYGRGKRNLADLHGLP